MADLLDMLSDAQASVQKSDDKRTVRICSYVYKMNGTWHDMTFEGSLADCNDAFLDETTRRGVDLRKIPWARGHKAGRNIVIHPKTDATAEAEVRKVMGRSPTPIPAMS